MEKLIQVGDKEINFKASGATVRIYREMFGRDLLMDISKLNDEFIKQNMSSVSLECFENLAFIMAKQGGNEMPSTADEWLDEFDMFSIYEILPQIVHLWNVSAEPKVEAKKNNVKQSGH